MAKSVINIEIPTTNIDFKIGKKTYSISLADKSRARINNRYDEITKYEDANGDSTQLMLSKYQDVIDNIEKERNKREDSKNPMTKQEEVELKQKAISEFQKKIDKNDKELYDKSEKTAIEFLDYIFGDGAGNEIYNLVDQNTIALSKIIFQIMTEFNRENNIYEYRQSYMKKLADMTDSDD